MSTVASIPRHESEKRELPLGWRWVRLMDVCRDISDGSHFTPSYVSEGIPFLSVKDVKENGLSFDDCRYITKEQHYEFCKRCRPEKGDVLYTKVGTTGIAKAVDVDIEFSIFVSVALLKLHSTVIPEYLEKVLNAPVCRRQAENLTRGMANRNLVLKDLKTIVLPLPSLEEQRRIAVILKEQMGAVEKARAAAQARLAAVKALPAAFLRQVFPQPGQPLPAGWRWIKLGEECKFVGGSQPSKGYFRYEPASGYVRLVQIQDFRLSGVAVFIPQEMALRTFEISDAMIGRYGPPVFQILRGLSGAYNVALMKTVPSENLDKDFLFFLLQWPEIQRDVIAQSQRSAGQSGVQKEYLEKYVIPLPPIYKQRHLATLLNKQTAAVERARAAAEAELESINALPAALLRRAFNGEI
jgi:type I restriction enzyme, S subunit